MSRSTEALANLRPRRKCVWEFVRLVWSLSVRFLCASRLDLLRKLMNLNCSNRWSCHQPRKRMTSIKSPLTRVNLGTRNSAVSPRTFWLVFNVSASFLRLSLSFRALLEGRNVSWQKTLRKRVHCDSDSVVFIHSQSLISNLNQSKSSCTD